MRARTWVLISAAGLAASLAPGARAQVRVGEWNVTNWDAGSVASRGNAFKSALYAIAPNGQQFAPDVLIVQEMEQGGFGTGGGHQATGQTNVNAFLNLLNTAVNSPGDWAAAAYVANNGDDGNALFYRTSKMSWVATASLTLNTGTGPGQPPRDNQRWRMRLFGYSGTGAEFYLYSSHMKAQEAGTEDDGRREAEAERIRDDSNLLPAGIGGFILGGDFNIQTSSDLAYQYLVGFNGGVPMSDPRHFQAGQLLDPINSPGSWNNSATWRFVHTQDPASAMDDRHDQLLVGASLLDKQGLSYIFVGSAGAPPSYSGGTWNDPNHTYRCWGNDGAHYNGAINSGAVNSQVGATIANDLVTTTAGSGHLPVYLDLQVPAKVGSITGTIDFGTVGVNDPAQYNLQITNAADVVRFSKAGDGTGIDSLTYTLAASAGFSAPAGTFNRSATAAPAQANNHIITMDTGTSGPKMGTLTITSDDPDTPARVIQLVGQVGATSPPDYDVNDDGYEDPEDVYAWMLGNTDVNGNGATNIADLVALLEYLRANEIPDMTFLRR